VRKNERKIKSDKNKMANENWRRNAPKCGTDIPC
jgi:hypothetical protein